MKQRTHHFVIGLFVLAGLSVLVGTLIWLGKDKISRDAIAVESYLEESVQGLETGSALRFRGVKVGQVSKILLVSQAYDTHLPYVLVRVSVQAQAFFSPGARGDIPTELQAMVDRGLRIRLASQGLTGLAYLEADFFDVDRFPAPEIEWSPESIYVPAVRSITSRVSNSLEAVLEKLAGIDLDGVLDEARASLQTVREQVVGAGLPQAGDNLRTLLTSMNDTVEGLGEDARAVLRKADAAADGLSRLLQSDRVEQTLASTQKMVDEGTLAMADLRSLVRRTETSVAALGETLSAGAEAQALMLDLRRLIESLQGLTEGLQRRPSPLLFGDPARKDRG